MSGRDFPENFLWGAASCPACCEGETVSDWGRFCAPDGSVPDDGPRHWRRYRYDFKIMAELGLKAYRFGCDWGRLQREPNGRLNRDDTFRYLEMLAELRSLGIEPWLVLFQNALPRWATAEGGWLNRETPHWFADFTRRLADVTDGEALNWVTIHEPQVYAMSCYAWGLFPGGEWGRLDKARIAMRRLGEGHRLAAATLRKRLPGVRVGLSLPGGCFFPRRRWHPGDWLAATVSEWLLSRFGLDGFLRDAGVCDFLMLGVGSELGVGAWDALSLSSGVAASLVKRMRHGTGDVELMRKRRQRIRDWQRRRRIPVYLVGGGSAAGERLIELLDAYAGETTASGFFYDPLMDQFDLHMGLASGGGLMQVDFYGSDRRREVRGFARRFGRVVKTGRVAREKWNA